MRLPFSRRHLPLLATCGLCVALYVAGSVLYPGFASLRVFVNFLSDNSFLGIIAVGMTFVILSGGIDLSVGSMLALSSTVLAVLLELRHVPVALAVGVVLAMGTALGAVMGLVIRQFRLAPFIVTLAGMFFTRGLAQIVHLEALPISNPAYVAATGWGLPLAAGVRVPLTAFIFLGVLAIGLYLSVYTPFGRNVYAVGGNEEAALLMGLPVGRTKVGIYALSGFCSSLSGVVFALYSSSGNPSAGVGTELDAIAAVVIGGTLLTGGVGHVLGTLVGVLIFGIIQTGITFQGTLSSWWTKVAIGALLLLFVLLQRVLARTGRGT